MNNIENSYDLLKFLKEKNLLENSPQNWWPSKDGFEILVGAILTQNTKWTNVGKSLQNLKDLHILDINSLCKIDLNILINAISSSGFKNQKAPRLKQLCSNIIEDFENFDIFSKKVTRTWLLAQKGIGEETADAILCYACKQDYMVVDKYTNRLLQRFNYQFQSYKELQDWIEYGINENLDKIHILYNYEISLNEIYSRFHGKIIEYMKQNPKD